MSATLSQPESTATHTVSAGPSPARTAAWVWWACLAGLFVWMFADVLFATNNFVYRDAAHFYYPLFKYIAAEWGAGRVPLWNPYENLGAPLVAQGTSSVFYPGKLVFALPIGFDAGFKLYVLGHVLLAAALAYRLARRWGSSVEAAALCGLSYAFGGNVVFQHCNVVFLVGAAWLPLAVEQIDRLFAERRLRFALPLGVTLSLMVLGGDPQMAYHVVLLGGIYAWLCRTDFQSVRAAESCGRIGNPSYRLATYRLTANRLILLGTGALFAAALAAVQILPSWELNSLSDRAAHNEPRNIYEAAADLLAQDRDRPAAASSRWDALLAKPTDTDSHAAQTYNFSVAPWRLAEYVWPNVAGREFPTHRRWMSALPAEGRVWVPSLYMGLLPLILALAAWRVRGTDARTAWLSGMVLLAVLGSFGSFGLGRLWREVAVHWNPALADPQNAALGDPFGGLYWLLTVLLPGYADFRYPAKLLVVAALGLSGLAARGWDEVIAGSPRGKRTKTLLLLVVAISAVGLIFALATKPWWSDWLLAADPNPLFGPLDVAGAWQDVSWACGQSLVVGALAWWIVRRCAGVRAAGTATSGNAAVSRLAYAAAVLTVLDLGLANRWMIATAPASAWHAPSALGEAIRASEAADGQPFRVDRPNDDWWPTAWKGEVSAGRQTEGLAWDRDTLLPRHPLTDGIEMLQAPDTSAVLDYQRFLDEIVRRGTDDDNDKHAGGLDVLGVKYLVLPRGTRPPQSGRWHLVRGADSEVGLWVNAASFPRAWIARQVEVLPELHSRRPDDVVQRTGEVLFPNGQPRDFHRSAAVETDEQSAVAVYGKGGTPDGGRIENPSYLDAADRCTIAACEPGRVELEAEVAEPGGLLVVSDLYYPGWRAEVATEGAEPRAAMILRTNRVMRGVPLLPGKHRVTFSYQPASVKWGAAASAAGWLTVVGLMVLRLVGQRRARKGIETKIA